MSDLKGPINLKVDVKLDGTDFINEVVTKPFGAVSNTLTSIWGLTFGWIDHFNEKKKIEKKHNLKQYKKLVEKEISNIEEGKLQEPKMSILGPAVQSSEFFFEEKHYREMFSKIIAGSFNSEYNDVIHPSFAKIITELSKNDAKVLKYLCGLRDNSESLKARRLEILFFGDLPKDSLYPNSIVTRKKYADLNPLDTNLSLSNLERLNLITVSQSVYPGEIFNDDKFGNAPLIKELKEKYPLIRYKIHPIQVNLTTLGKSFAKVCL